MSTIITSSKGDTLTLTLKGECMQYFNGHEQEDLLLISEGVLTVLEYVNLDKGSHVDWGFAPAWDIPVVPRTTGEGLHIVSVEGEVVTLVEQVTPDGCVFYREPGKEVVYSRTKEALIVTGRMGGGRVSWLGTDHINSDPWGFVPASLTPLGQALRLQEEEARLIAQEKEWQQKKERALLLQQEAQRIVSLSGGLASYRVQGGVKYLDLSTICMVDWDPKPEGEHDTTHFTISSIEEVEALLIERVALHPDELWQAYLTPSGGVHAFLVSHSLPVEEGVKVIEDMHGDLIYAEMSLKRGKYGVRVSPKKVDGVPRRGDYIAKAWKSFGNGTALPENVAVMQLHDSFLPVASRPDAATVLATAVAKSRAATAAAVAAFSFS